MPKRRNGCTGKVRHPTKEGAIIAAKRMRNRGLDIYRCGRCGGWHCGTSNKPWKVQARISQLLGRS